MGDIFWFTTVGNAWVDGFKCWLDISLYFPWPMLNISPYNLETLIHQCALHVALRLYSVNHLFGNTVIPMRLACRFSSILGKNTCLENEVSRRTEIFRI